MEVCAKSGVIESEKVAIGQRLAPEKLMISPKSGAVSVGVFPSRVSPKVERDVDSHEFIGSDKPSNVRNWA